jgi:HTH-type transcriptional regulator/antitoxin HigA
MRPVGDAELLRFLIEQKGITQNAAASGAGISESTVSEVLAGKRKLNRTRIAKLARYFHVEPGAFLS